MMRSPVPVNKTLPATAQLLAPLIVALGLLAFMPDIARAEAGTNALSQETQLIEIVHVKGRLVLLADLIKNAGVKGSVPVFRSPDPGTTGKVSVKRILAAARKHGLNVSRTPTFSMISIKRTSRVIELEELEDLVRGRLEGRLSEAKGKGQLVIKLPDSLKQLHVDPEVQGELSLSSLDWSPRTGRFTARFALDGTDPIVLKGTASLMVELAVAKTSISRGKIISASDIEMKFVKSRRRGRQKVAALEEMIGLSAKRRLQAGKPININDLEAPVLIRKNQLVTILLEAPGLVIRTEGKALADATTGETVRVLNTQSKRIIHATARASGLVSVSLSGANGS